MVTYGGMAKQPVVASVVSRVRREACLEPGRTPRPGHIPWHNSCLSLGNAPFLEGSLYP